MDSGHFISIFDDAVARRGERTALRHKVDGTWTDISWRVLGEQVRAAARGLVAAGVRDGETVGILSPNRPEWTVADVAIQRVRGVSVPVHATSAAAQAA